MLKYNVTLLFLFLIIEGYSQLNVTIAGYREAVYIINPNATEDLSDLIPFKAFVCDRKIVAMGEATHGTKEFFNTKAKMFKFLATYCGYKVFLIEAPYGGTLQVNNYIIDGNGDLLTSMKGMRFWTWDTEEVKNLIEWMRLYNYSKKNNEKLKFFGFDCQGFNEQIHSLSNYINGIDKENYSEFSKGLEILKDSSDFYWYKLNNNINKNEIVPVINNILTFLDQWFKERKSIYISRSGSEEYNIVVYNIEVLKQAISIIEKSYDYRRDSCMAQNVKWIFENENSKVFVWAHNLHISKLLQPDWELQKVGGKRMGSYLKDFFGSDFYNIGFVFNEGYFMANQYKVSLWNRISGKSSYQGLKRCYLPPAPVNSLPHIFSQTNINSFIVDLRNSSNKLYKEPSKYYLGGAVFYNRSRSIYTMIPNQNFDALVFVELTQSSILINRKK